MHAGDMPARADALVFEVLDSELLGEGVLPCLRDARARLLTPAAAVVPARARVYASLVECDALQRCCALPGCLSRDGGADDDGVDVCTLAPLHALHLDAFGHDLRVITPPAEVLRFDFCATDGVPPEAGAAGAPVSTAALVSGNVHAVAVWWEADVDAAGEACYSTAPRWARAKAPLWTHHWRQCVAFLPAGGVSVKAQQALSLRAYHDDHSIWFRISLALPPCGDPIPPPADPAHVARLGSRERVWQLNDERYTSALAAAAASTLAAAAPDEASLRVAVLGDGPVLPILAAAMPRVVSVTALVSQNDQLAVIARAARTNTRAPVRAALVSRFCNDGDAGTPREDAFDAVLAEPYFSLLDVSSPPWAPALRFWRDVSRLRAARWLRIARAAPLMPSMGILHATLASLPALWRSRAAVGTVCGIDVSRANALLRPPCGGAFSAAQADDSEPVPLAPAFPVALFQCANEEAPFAALSPSVAVARLDFAASSFAPMAGDAAVVTHTAGVADALVLWMSYEAPGGVAFASAAPERRADSDDLAPSHARQAVALFRAPRAVAPGDRLRIEWALDEELQLRVQFSCT